MGMGQGTNPTTTYSSLVGRWTLMRMLSSFFRLPHHWKSGTGKYPCLLVSKIYLRLGCGTWRQAQFRKQLLYGKGNSQSLKSTGRNILPTFSAPSQLPFPFVTTIDTSVLKLSQSSFSPSTSGSIQVLQRLPICLPQNLKQCSGEISPPAIELSWECSTDI